MRKFKACYAKTYTDAQGQQKTSWKTVGYANEIISQDGKTTIHLSLDSIPTGNWDGELKLFLQDEQNIQQGGYAQPQQQYQQPAQTYQAPHGQVPVYEQQPNNTQPNQQQGYPAQQ